ncbi:hypothetical protein LBMAG52_40520 [Planctomycetia bacterium]|nr:hypothetical protein LBMAG52_40520 [Planctomycetia bacterium]
MADTLRETRDHKLAGVRRDEVLQFAEHLAEFAAKGTMARPQDTCRVVSDNCNRSRAWEQ